MGIYNLYSKRQRQLRGEIPDVFSYDNIPNSLRVQIVHIIRDAIGRIRGQVPAARQVIKRCSYAGT